MQNQQNLRNKISLLFGLPAMKMPWSLYLAQLNEAGKLTARSTMDILTVVLTSMEEQEEKIKSLQPEKTIQMEADEESKSKIPEAIKDTPKSQKPLK
ncbi:MAG: hypothetical protein LAN71_17740 [Acidobacteriia bacterium]|nr:hypothetical protein [Terriglobia bacterium]